MTRNNVDVHFDLKFHCNRVLFSISNLTVVVCGKQVEHVSLAQL